MAFTDLVDLIQDVFSWPVGQLNAFAFESSRLSRESIRFPYANIPFVISRVEDQLKPENVRKANAQQILPLYDLFAPNRPRNECHMNYEPIKDLFLASFPISKQMTKQN